MSKTGFRSTLREDGTVQAGGMTLFQATPNGKLVFEDRYQRRCAARGTPDVSIDILDLMGQLLDYYADCALDKF